MVTISSDVYKEVIYVLAHEQANNILVGDVRFEVPFEQTGGRRNSKTQEIKVIYRKFDLDDDDLENPQLYQIVHTALFKLLDNAGMIKLDRVKEILGDDFEKQPSKEIEKKVTVWSAVKKALWLA